MRNPHVRLLPAGLAVALLLTVAPGCVGYHAYEKQVAATEAAAARAAEADALAERAETCRRENDHLVLRNHLLQTELASTRTQYGQLEHANADLLHRYDRYIAHTDYEAEANASERSRLTEAAARREREVLSARQQIESLSEAAESREARLAAAPSVPFPPAGAHSQAQSYGEFERPKPATTAADPRLIGVCGELKHHLEAQLTGYLPGELRVRDEGHQVSVDVSLAMLFPGASQELGSLGMTALRQTARALAKVEMTRVVVSIPQTDPHSPGAAPRSCPACAKTVAAALVTAGLGESVVSCAPAVPAGPLYDHLSNGEVSTKTGFVTITIVPVLPKGDNRSLSGLRFDR